MTLRRALKLSLPIWVGVVCFYVVVVLIGGVSFGDTEIWKRVAIGSAMSYPFVVLSIFIFAALTIKRP